MKRSFIAALIFLTLLLSGAVSDIHAQTMESYCQLPPFLSSSVESNILFAVDASGSMGYEAYSYNDSDGNDDGYLDGYHSGTTYEGYFTPSKYYKTDANGIYEETASTGQPCTCTCVKWKCSLLFGCVWHGGGCWTWGCCTQETCTGDCNISSGNYLNYKYMTRIDLLRWAMTGGAPTSCSDSTSGSAYCDPELWSRSGNSSNNKVGTACNDSLDVNGDGVAEGGCVLRTYNGQLVKVPWERVKHGLLLKLEDVELRPRLGAMFFKGNGVTKEKVFVGDYTESDYADPQFPFVNLIAQINSVSVSDYTPTGPALRDALNYFAQNSPMYGGFTPQKGDGSEPWRNPMYVCDWNKTNCKFISCSNNFLILMSDGQWNRPDCAAGSDPVRPAYEMHIGFKNFDVKTKVTAVYTLGLFLGGSGELALKNIAMYGSFDYDPKNKIWPDSRSGYPQTSCDMDDCGKGAGSACTKLPGPSPDWDKNSDGVPDTFFKADHAIEIRNTIQDAILDIMRHSTSGTAVSILASGEGSGANLLQAFFYPKKAFDETEIAWTGEMQNLWYYLDPKLQSSTIREDTSADNKLSLKDDNIINFRFDTGSNKTKADRHNGRGDFIDTVELEEVKNLWEAGKILWQRESPRTILTTLDGKALVNFTDLDPNSTTVQSYLGASAVEAAKIINYTKGMDVAGYRNRTVTVPALGSTPHVWKLGDIISSTPKIQSWVALNNYHNGAPHGYDDSQYQKYIDSDDYKARGMVYVGANDGMLHAFTLGKLKMTADPSNPELVAGLEGIDLGGEAWTFIPKNALPYLRYLTDPGYCHLYYVDASPYLFDASIARPSDCVATDYASCEKKTEFIEEEGKLTNKLDWDNTSWRTVLIGGMGSGGACKNSTVTCDSTNSVDLNGDGKVDNSDCVRTPGSSIGYSSYFAINVTNSGSPSLMWEFSDPNLGYSTTGPAIVRVRDRGKNGRWFAVFASGPTGPIETSSHQFYGNSDQNLRIFVLDLRTGEVLRTIVMDGSQGTPNVPYAFGGSILNTTIDADRWKPDRPGNYQDDVFYIPYVQRSGSAWTNGGVLRITTNESPDPGNWAVSSLIKDIGPVTSSVVHLQDRKTHECWLYFGTGRYYYKIAGNIDDAESKRTIFGVKEPCYDKDNDRFIPNCSSSVSGLKSPPSGESDGGWYIDLDGSGTSYKAERVITNPLAAFTGAVFFTTFAPSAEVCGFGGNTYLWAVDYRTGDAPKPSALYGTALVQVSTGEIKEFPLSSVFTQKGGRRTEGSSGVPPKNQGLTVVVRPQPIKKILHMQEK